VKLLRSLIPLLIENVRLLHQQQRAAVAVAVHKCTQLACEEKMATAKQKATGSRPTSAASTKSSGSNI